jgi:transcriptional regulator with XRE-family HTH domain
MHRIQDIRTTLGVSQADFAKALGMPAHLISLWEQGSAEPDIPSLRHIATLLGTSVDALMEYDLSGRRMASRHWFPSDHPLMDGYWGYLGLQLPGRDNCDWYPISQGEHALIGDALGMEHDEPQWIVVSTLNNRKLVINPELIRRIRLVDDDPADRPQDDTWEMGWDDACGMLPELYRALHEYYVDDYAFRACNSLETQNLIPKLVTRYDLDEQKVLQLTAHCSVHLASGTTTVLRVANADLYNLVLDAYSGMPLGITLGSPDTGEQNVFSPLHVALVEIPLLQYEEAESEASAAMEGE